MQDIQWAMLNMTNKSLVSYKIKITIGDIWIWSWMVSSIYFSFNAFNNLKTLEVLKIFKYESEN